MLPDWGEVAISGGFSLVEEVFSCIKKGMEEQTQRLSLEHKVSLASVFLEKRREMIESFLSHRFAERQELYAGLFLIMEKALETGNVKLLERVFKSLTTIYHSSALEGIDEVCRQYEWFEEDCRNEKSA